MNKTIGEHRVRTDFNPEKNSLVDQIKQTSADLINMISSIPDGADYDREAGRLKALAMTSIEEGAMWAVKAATCERVLPPAPDPNPTAGDRSSMQRHG